MSITMIRIAAVAAALTASGAGPGEARHGGSGYGLQGGVTDVLAQANVFSGIYGLDYTYDRRHYDFTQRCPDPDQAVAAYVLTCPLGTP